MTIKNTNGKESTKKKQKIHRSAWEDLRKGDIKRTLRQDVKDIYDFYLDKDTRARLSNMGRVKRWITMQIWLLKSLFLKLTPVRRILLLISLWGFVLFSSSFRIGDLQLNVNLRLLSFVILLFILALELKDKLLAHDELAAGRAVQFALMPEKSPKVTGWDIWLYTRPANEVGGDMVDYIWIHEDRLGLALGDVAGKGLGAAMVMAKLQATLRALAPNFKSLSKLGSELNTIFRRDGLPNRFISLVYLELGPNSGKIRILNTGHLPPYILRHGKMKELNHGAAALGILPKPKYDEQLIELKKDELLMVYSDGVTEARNEEGEFFGEQRLLNLMSKCQDLTAQNVGEHILTEVKQFIGDARPHDDLSLILMKRLS